MEIRRDTTAYTIVRQCVRELKVYAKYQRKKRKRPDRIKCYGVTLELDRSDSESVRDALYRKRYESTEVICLKQALEPHDVVMEIGAGLGFISTFCAKKAGSEKVFAFEANPELIPRIQQTYARNNVSPTLQQAVLDSHDGVRTFHIYSDFRSSSLLERKGPSKVVDVPALDVNRELARIQPTFLIVDVEGNEVDLLPAIDFFHAGASVRKILIELHENVTGKAAKNSLRHYLTEQGFSVNANVSHEEVIFLEKLSGF